MRDQSTRNFLAVGYRTRPSPGLPGSGAGGRGAGETVSWLRQFAGCPPPPRRAWPVIECGAPFVGLPTGRAGLCACPGWRAGVSGLAVKPASLAAFGTAWLAGLRSEVHGNFDSEAPVPLACGDLASAPVGDVTTTKTIDTYSRRAPEAGVPARQPDASSLPRPQANAAPAQSVARTDAAAWPMLRSLA
jgi:hypothetical protein